jgi:hypothetical protein
MNKIIYIIPIFLLGCLSKLKLNKPTDNQEVTKSILEKEPVVLSPGYSSSYTFLIIILGVMFFCFGLKYIPILYKKLKSLTKDKK